ncbi:hypothetical protein M0802_012096 [Mischocyttarus mexicanus]|nr:hypothetical protein M0802_012096 [Mischocyttarus mexicanus]
MEEAFEFYDEKKKPRWNKDIKKISDNFRTRIKYHNGQEFKNNLQRNGTNVLTVRENKFEIEDISFEDRESIENLKEINNIKIKGLWNAQLIYDKLKSIIPPSENIDDHIQSITQRSQLNKTSFKSRYDSFINYFPFVTMPINNSTVYRFIGMNGSDINELTKESKTIIRNYPVMLKKIKEQHLRNMNPIQSQAWPILLSGKDMLGIIPTIFNTVLTFLLPALIHISKQNSFLCGHGPNVLILVPNKTEALKIQKEVDKYSYFGITAVSLYFGGNKHKQIKALKNKPEILIATPQRLNVLIKMKVLKLKYITYVILNGVDNMLEMNFAFDIKTNLSYVRFDTQFVMISAKSSKEVKYFAQMYMTNPIVVFIKST